MIALAEPVLDGKEAQYLQECIDTGFVSSAGPFVARFEREFADAVGARYAVACVSGTAALHVALLLAGARPERMVAVSDFTFIASANAVSYTGADLLLVDSETDTWNMNTEMLHDEVMRRARMGQRIPDIIEVVHVLGHPAVMEPLLALQRKFGIAIVEDAAESLGASWTAGDYVGRQVGTVGDMGCFSFNGNKVITTGGGGMIVTDRADLAGKAKHLVNQAKLAGHEYLHDTVGFNYRLTNIAAAIGTAQVERLTEMIAAKRAIADRYTMLLRGLPAAPAPRAKWADPSRWLYSILLSDPYLNPAMVVSTMVGMGIGARRLWPPLHKQKPYAVAERVGGEVSEDIYRRGISLPSSASLSSAEQDAVAAAFIAALDKGRHVAVET